MKALLLLALLWPGWASAQAVFDGALVWPERGWQPGGLSGLIMAPDGTEMIALSDQAFLVTARIERDGDGRLIAIDAAEERPVLPPPDANWPDTPLYSDSEGLAALADGRIAIAYEGLQRVSIHDASGAFDEWIEVPQPFYSLRTNAGLEAVAAAPDGTIYTLPEAWPPDPEHLPLFAFDGADWSVAAEIEARPPFAPVGLDIDAEGRFYLLERSFSLRRGFASRLWRFEVRDGAVAEEVLLLDSAPGRHGNLEGISLWRRADGTRMASFITDNNFNPFLPRGLVEYRLPD